MRHPRPVSQRNNDPPLPILIVSGGSGTSGEQAVHSLLAQFPHFQFSVALRAHVRNVEQMEAAVEDAAVTGAVIVHTLVDSGLRQQLVEYSLVKGVPTFDLFGPLLNHLATRLGQAPLGKPGLYQQLHAAYFKRVEAIEYAVAHDDGKRIDDLSSAEIVLTGVSRVGKTPLSMYLSVLGWKVANVPFVSPIPPPPELLRVDPQRVVGLTIAPIQLLAHRRWRTKSLGVSSGAYVDVKAVQEELRAANHFFAAHHFAIVDTTDKPVETSGEEVIAAISQ